MRLDEFESKKLIAESNAPVRQPGRWPNGNQAEKEKEANLDADRGVTHSLPGKTIHKAGGNYSGKGYKASADSKSRGTNKDPHLAMPVGGRQGGSFNSRSFREDSKLDEISPSLKARASAAGVKKWHNSADELDSTEAKHGKFSPESDVAFKKYSKAGDQMGRLSLAHAKTGKLEEVTGDPSFDKMMGNIAGNDTPRAMPAQGTGQVDRKIMELTHKIFLTLREYDDPEVYQKFINFMTKTITANVGPLDESKK